MTVRHPAKYSAALLPILASVLAGCTYVLDPMGGTGKLGQIKQHGWHGWVYVNELEPEWAAQAKANGADTVTIGDAGRLPYRDGVLDAVCVSPVYGNKMSEHCDWKPERVCHTYKSYLGRALADGNAGRFYFWEREYADIHWRAWLEAWRVLKRGGLFVLNSKDFPHRGEIQRVTDWHVSVLERIGFDVVERHQVICPGQRHGKNGHLRVDHEDVVVLRKR